MSAQGVASQTPQLQSQPAVCYEKSGLAGTKTRGQEASEEAVRGVQAGDGAESADVELQLTAGERSRDTAGRLTGAMAALTRYLYRNQSWALCLTSFYS